MTERAADPTTPPSLAFVLTGGGARAAYQVGFLRSLARRHPEFRIPVLSGFSAGAINAAFLANHPGPLPRAVDELAEIWLGLTPDRVFRVDALSLLRGGMQWVARLLSGGSDLAPEVRGLLDTGPLRELLEERMGARCGNPLPGIATNLEDGDLQAIGLSTVEYATGRTVVWVQGTELRGWERPSRRGVEAQIGVEHVMASAALPFLFPAVELDGSWYGDGGIRLTSPLAPAVHMGARRIIALATRYDRSPGEAATVQVSGYPPPAQVAGVLLNAIFLDLLDQDALHLERTNQLLRAVGPGYAGELHEIDLLVLRPSRDLGALAARFEPELPRAFRWLTRGLGTQETKNSDLLAMLMFLPGYIRELIAIGEQDAERNRDAIDALIAAG